jgi:hypothetical protein
MLCAAEWEGCPFKRQPEASSPVVPLAVTSLVDLLQPSELVAAS